MPPVELNTAQLERLAQFADMKVDLAELRSSLRGLFEFEFGRAVRKATEHFAPPNPGVLIQRRHVTCALNKLKIGEITPQTLMVWATVLLLSSAYELDPAEEDFLADCLNDMSWGFEVPTALENES